MCGICGEINFNNEGVNAGTIQRMCKVLAHRGPDDEGMALFEATNILKSKAFLDLLGRKWF